MRLGGNSPPHVRYSVRYRHPQQVQVALLPTILPFEEHLRHPSSDRKRHIRLSIHLDIQLGHYLVQVQLVEYPVDLSEPRGGPVPAPNPLLVLQWTLETATFTQVRVQQAVTE